MKFMEKIMKLYKFSLIPKSTFITPLKGDILYGQIIKFIFESKKTVDKDDFIISDCMLENFFFRPNLPLNFFETDKDVEKKEIRKIKFVDFKGNYKKYFFKKSIVIKNSLNRVSFVTGEGFDPFSLIEIIYPKLWGFIYVKEEKKDLIFNALKQVGEYGYGAKTSIGKGQFIIEEIKEWEFKEYNSGFYMSLSATILKGINEKVYYEPYVKFAKFGFAKKNPFKKPVIFADSSSVFELKNNPKCIGKNLEYDNYFIQGKSILVSIPKKILLKGV